MNTGTQINRMMPKGLGGSNASDRCRIPDVNPLGSLIGRGRIMGRTTAPRWSARELLDHIIWEAEQLQDKPDAELELVGVSLSEASDALAGLEAYLDTQEK